MYHEHQREQLFIAVFSASVSKDAINQTRLALSIEEVPSVPAT